jgi:hypothetical protein
MIEDVVRSLEAAEPGAVDAVLAAAFVGVTGRYSTQAARQREQATPQEGLRPAT